MKSTIKLETKATTIKLETKASHPQCLILTQPKEFTYIENSYCTHADFPKMDLLLLCLATALKETAKPLHSRSAD